MGCVGNLPASRRAPPMASLESRAAARARMESVPVMVLREGNPKAAAAIWHWRAEEPVSEARPSAASVRLRGSLQALVGAAFGLASHLFWSKTVAIVAFTAAGLVLFCALASPHGLYALLRRLFEATGRVVGRAMTWIVMVPIFYLFFLPFGKLMRRGRRDRLHRYFDAEAETYWEPHTPIPTSSLERQY